MFKAFRISYSLRNTYRVNSIIYSFKQLPLIKKLLPSTLYQVSGFKILANIVSAIWEIISTFLGKYLYLFLMVSWVCALYEKTADAQAFLHIFFILSIIGAYMNSYMFNPTKDKYYAMMLMRMDAKVYTLSNYIYALVKVLVGFLPFTIGIGLMRHIPLWLCILFPFFIVGAKMLSAWLFLERYIQTGECTNEAMPPKIIWPITAVLLMAAYGLPFLGITIPFPVLILLMLLTICVGVYAAVQIAKFNAYREMYQILLANMNHGMDYAKKTKNATVEQSRKIISQETNIKSGKKGFEYLNELFVKRHRRILWRPAKRVAAIAFVLVMGLLFVFQLDVKVMTVTNEVLMQYLPYFVFVMYLINRGTSFTQALFMNCDHSMLTYSFYKKPRFILQLFQIRLREIIKVNLLPAAIIGMGLPILLYCSGGTEHPLNYIVLLVSILSLSVFFSVHYLTCYYLLQPYNVNTEIKSGTYRVVIWITYIVCFAFMHLQMNTLTFGILVTCFCILYCFIACVLVYKLASKTFQLRI